MIQGTHVYLRPVVATDLPIIEAWSNDPVLSSAYNNFGLQRAGRFESGFQQTGFLEARQGMLMVVVRASGVLAGHVSYHQVMYGPNEGSRAYNIGIELVPEQQGHGYGAEAQALLAAYLFATYPIMRVEASTDTTNLAEQRSLSKAGFTREGVARKAQWRAGEWRDLVVYSKLRGE